MIGMGISFAYAVLTAYVGYRAIVESNEEFWLVLKNNAGESFYHLLSIVLFLHVGSAIETEVNMNINHF